MIDSVVECRRVVFDAVCAGIVDRRAIDYVVQNGRPKDDESPLGLNSNLRQSPPSGMTRCRRRMAS